MVIFTLNTILPHVIKTAKNAGDFVRRERKKFTPDKIEIKGLATSGWKPLGTYHTVTKAEGNVIHTINNVPALDFFIRF